MMRRVITGSLPAAAILTGWLLASPFAGAAGACTPGSHTIFASDRNALACGAAANVTETTPKTLAYAETPILDFAQDGNDIAWAAKGCPALVRVRDLARSKQSAVGQLTLECRFERDSQLVSAGDRALWTFRDQGNENYTYAVSGGLGRGKAHVVGINGWDSSGYGIGDHLGAIAGGGGLLLWSKIVVSVRGADDCDQTQTCIPYVQGGGVYHVVGARSQILAGPPPSVLLATDGKHIALLAAGIGGERPRAKRDAKVEVRTASGALVSTFSPGAAPKVLAVNGPYVAVLTRSAVELRSLAGALVWKRPVPSAAASLSLSPIGVVYRVASTIHRLDPGGVPTLVGIARAVPVGLSASGHRVAWAENISLGGKQRGRVQAVELGG
jgi:hypothetical protein